MNIWRLPRVPDNSVLPQTLQKTRMSHYTWKNGQCNSYFITLDIFRKEVQNNGIENEFYACPVFSYGMRKYGRVIGLNQEEVQKTEKDTVQLKMEEMQLEIERQKELLDENAKEIAELKKLFKDSGREQTSGVPHDYYKDSLEEVYEIVSGLEKYTTEEVLFYAAQILSELMGTKDVAIYTVANRDYARLCSATSREARKLGNSIKYTAMGELYDTLKNGRIYMNASMAEEFPLMASAVYDQEEIRVFLMFWGIPAERMTQTEVKRLTVIEMLLQNAILRASRYMANFRRQRYLEGTNVLNEEAFTILVNAFLEAKEKGLTECALVEVDKAYESYEDVSTNVACNIRQTDYMGLMEGEKLYILLANTDMKNAEVVQERLRKLGYESTLKEDVA